jgi:hypothetical protein
MFDMQNKYYPFEQVFNADNQVDKFDTMSDAIWVVGCIIDLPVSDFS